MKIQLKCITFFSIIVDYLYVVTITYFCLKM